MKTPEENAALVDRLIELTQTGRLNWQYLYPDDNAAPDYYMQQAGLVAGVTMPNAYVLEDSTFGFGLVLFQLRNPQNEDYDPKLFMHGEEIETMEQHLTLLRDIVKVYFEDVQMGQMPNQQERFESMMAATVAPYAEELDSVRMQVQKAQEQQSRMIDIMDRQSLALLYAAAPKGGPPPGMPAQAPEPHNVQVLMTPDTLQAVLRHLINSQDSNFNSAFSKERCEIAIRAFIEAHQTSVGN